MEQSSYMKQPSLILSVKEEENATQRSGWSLCSDCWFGCFGIAESPRPSLHFSLLASVPWTMVAKVDFSFSSGSRHLQGLKLDLAVWHEVLTSSRGSQAYLQVRCLSTALFGLTASGKCLSHQLSQTASALQQVKIAHFQPQQSGVLSSYHKPSWKKILEEKHKKPWKHRPKTSFSSAGVHIRWCIPQQQKPKVQFDNPVLSEWDISETYGDTQVGKISIHLPSPQCLWS